MLIKLQNLIKEVQNGKSKRILFNNLNMNIEQGDFIGIKGKSGIGKTTLLNILGGLDSFQSGSYFFENIDISNYSLKKLSEFRRKKIGIVNQQFQLLDDRNVYENIALPLRYDKVKKEIRKERVNQILSELELNHYKNNSISKLSGGERQRVAIGRALIRKPSVLLADEPTGSLDEETESKIMNIFENLNKKGITIILVTHDDTVAKRCNKVLILKKDNLSLSE